MMISDRKYSWFVSVNHRHINEKNHFSADRSSSPWININSGVFYSELLKELAK